MSEGITIIVPIAHDLLLTRTRGSNMQGVRCGPGTQAACDHAIALLENNPDGRILVTATTASTKYHSVVMGRVMQDYIQAKSGVKPHFNEADYFRTVGEVLAVGEYVHELRTLCGPDAVRKVMFAAKSWHAERVRAIVQAVWQLYRLTDVPYRIRQHRAPGRFVDKWLEPFKQKRDLTFLASLPEPDWLLKDEEDAA
jgi:hypothetical protein